MKTSLSVAAACLFTLVGCSSPLASVPQEKQNAAAPAFRAGDMIRFHQNHPQLRRIRVEPANEEDVATNQVTAPGKVEVNPGRIARIALPAAGRVREVPVVLGDDVRRGQPVLILESPEISSMQSALRQADANISQARAALAKAEADLERARDLLEHGAIARKEVLAIETTLAQAKAFVEQALAARDETDRKMRLLGLQPGITEHFISVNSPISGKIIEVAVASGEYRSDTAAPVLTIADLSTVWVTADVAESDIRFIQIGERVSISLPAYPGQTFSGRVTRIGDSVNPETRTIKVRAEIHNPNGNLRPEMFAQTRHDHGTRKLPTVPRGAVLQQEGRTLVYIERQPGQFQEVPVTLGWQGPDRVAIATGISPGDRVVVDGAMLLRGTISLEVDRRP